MIYWFKLTFNIASLHKIVIFKFSTSYIVNNPVIYNVFYHVLVYTSPQARQAQQLWMPSSFQAPLRRPTRAVTKNMHVLTEMFTYYPLAEMAKSDTQPAQRPISIITNNLV